MTASLRKARTAALVTIAALVAAASLTSFGESYRGLYAWSREHGLRGAWAVIWPLQVDVFIAVGELALFVGLVGHWTRRNRAGAWAVTLAGLAVSVAGNVGHITGHAVTSRVTAAVPPLAAAAALAVGLGVLKRVVAANVSDLPVGKSPPRGGNPPAESDGSPGESGNAVAEFEPVPELAGLFRAPVPDDPAGGGMEHLNGTAGQPARKINGASVPGVPEPGTAGLDVLGIFADDLGAGHVPAIRRIKRDLRIGTDRAQEVQAYLKTLTRT